MSEAVLAKRAEREARIRMLYEEYIQLHPVMETWHSPVTDKPRIEPCFAAGMQSIELTFVLLSRFLSDEREYVVKRPRIERVAADIQEQCRLLAEIVDGELEDENVPDVVLGSLTQAFPFDGSPPTTSERDCDRARQSVALDLVIDAARAVFPRLRVEEKHSLRKVIRNVTGTFQTHFSEWTVGIGLEEQLSELRVLVGLAPFQVPFGRKYLDFGRLVRPRVIVDALNAVEYRHKEDFFFRSVHLGTECWCFVALERLRSALGQIESFNHWDNAAAHVRSAANILEYLGNHVMLLTSMVLRDYLKLKVEIEGTSGAGSAAVKLLRSSTEALFAPFVSALAGSSEAAAALPEGGLEDLILDLYKHPERQPGMYNYAKSLETVESGLLGGFFFRHYCLASNVIGSGAKGTMKMAVQALKKTYERPVFPILDFVRAELGRRTDEELAHLKGRIMDEIEEQKRSGTPPRREFVSSDALQRQRSSEDDFEATRLALYSEEGIPDLFLAAARNERAHRGDALAFLDHAWGRTPPAALAGALRQQYALLDLGNRAWDVFFQELLPEAAGHVRRVLDAERQAPVEFGHNSHELAFRLISIKLDAILGGPKQKVRVLLTDAEFYSITRQVNRLSETSSIALDIVPAEPVETFADRLVSQASKGYDIVYVSQCTYLTQQTLVPDVPSLASRLNEAMGVPDANCADAGAPFLVVDGYHGFGAIPTTLRGAPGNLFYVAGALKHVAGGPNCAFVVTPPGRELRPFVTGWLADPTVLAPNAAGVSVGSSVGYTPGFALMGGTPSFLPAVLGFVQVMRRWLERGVTVEKVHAHVLGLHERFVGGLPPVGPISLETLRKPKAGRCRSHTLVFQQASPEEATRVVKVLFNDKQVEVDTRKGVVRVGFGLNHSLGDVTRLLHAVQGAAWDPPGSREGQV